MSLTKIIKTIKENKKFLVCTHVNPDPDALASQLAMALFLKSLGKTVHAMSVEEIPARFAFIPAAHLVRAIGKNKIDYDVAVVLDCGDLNRIDQVKQLLISGKKIINIDHHLTNDLFGDINFVAPEASSTAEVLFRLFKAAKFPLTKDIAILLYLGIMTDTGSFRYDSTTAFTHAATAEIMQFKFSVSELYRKLYERVPLDDLRVFTRIVNKFEKLHDGRVLYIEMRKKTLEQFSPEFDVRDKIFSFLRAIKGVEVIVILTEAGPKETRVNFRSQGESVNVGELAHFFKGGGHRKASGCMLLENMKTTKQLILAQLEKML